MKVFVVIRSEGGFCDSCVNVAVCSSQAKADEWIRKYGVHDYHYIDSFELDGDSK